MGKKNTVAQNNTRVAFLALEGLALAALAIADIRDQLPSGELRDACEEVGLKLVEGGELLLDQMQAPDSEDQEADAPKDYQDEDDDEVSVDDEADADVLRNEVVNFAGIAFFADAALKLIEEHTVDTGARNTAETARAVIAEAIGDLPEVEGDPERGFEAVALSAELSERAVEYALEYAFDRADEDLAA